MYYFYACPYFVVRPPSFFFPRKGNVCVCVYGNKTKVYESSFIRPFYFTESTWGTVGPTKAHVVKETDTNRDIKKRIISIDSIHPKWMIRFFIG